jgi:predicted Zn-dependent protease
MLPYCQIDARQTSAGVVWAVVLAAVGGASWLVLGQSPNDPRLWQHRNLGKAFYENPTTHAEAVAELKQALALAPDSVARQLNYGLALLRQGDTDTATAELLKVQKLDPKLPHTWFNLGILYKKQNETDKAHGAVPGDGAAGAQRAGVALPVGRPL